jgi:hypothetical protein
MTSAQFHTIANAYGCNVLGVQIVANYLRTVKEPVEEVLENITEEAHRFHHGQEKKVQCCLHRLP